MKANSIDLDSSLEKDSQTAVSDGDGGEIARTSEVDLSFGKKEVLVFPFDDHLVKEDNLYDVIADRPLPIGGISHHEKKLFCSVLSVQIKLWMIDNVLVFVMSLIRIIKGYSKLPIIVHNATNYVCMHV